MGRRSRRHGSRHRRGPAFAGLVFCCALALAAPGSVIGRAQASPETEQTHLSGIPIIPLTDRGFPFHPGYQTRVALALSGGGARGLAQIGVLRALEENNIAPTVICGVSMGAVIGGLYASGISPDSLATLARSLDWAELLTNAAPRSRLLLSQKEKRANWFVSIPLQGFRPQLPTGAISGQGLYNFLASLTQGASYRSGANFDSLTIRYRAVATDLVSGERMVFDHGELAFAMRAAMAFPLAVTPLRDGTRLYADGGLVDPLPVELARSLSADPVIAINTATGLVTLAQLNDPYAVANQATTVMTSERLAAALEEADYVCTPGMTGTANVDFQNVDSVIALGYQAGRELAARILRQESSDPPQPLRSQMAAADVAAAPIHLSGIELEGQTVLERDELLNATGLTIGEAYTAAEFGVALGRLIRLYERAGFTLADIRDARIDRAGLLKVVIDEAPLAGIKLSGNRSVRNWVVLRSFPLKRGAPYNARKVADGLTDLQASGLFEQVTTSIERTPDGPVLHLSVTEKTTDALRVGLHHNLEYQTEGFLQWADINLFGLGNELTAHAQYAPRREQYFVSLRSDRIFRSYLSTTIGVYYRRHERRLYAGHERVGTFSAQRRGVEASLAQNISRFAQMAALIRSEDVEFEQDSTQSKVRHSQFALVASLDDLDDDDFPTRGRRLRAALTWADDFLSGELIYRSFRAEGFWVVSPHNRLALNTEVRFATADRRLPLQERVGVGGRRSFMGMSDDELLHEHIVTLSLGARYRFYPISHLIARADIGNAWAHGFEIDFWRALRAGAGIGLAFDTPFGPLVILQGLADGGDAKFYFSWGYDF